MKITTYRTALLLFLLIGSISHAELVQVRWENPDVSELGKPFLDAQLRTVIINTGPTGIRLVDPASDPASPFPDDQPALLVESIPDAPFWFRLHFRPFDDAGVREGAVEFELQPIEGQLILQVGNHPTPWVPDLIETYAVTNSAFSISFNLDEAPMIAGIPVETASISHVMADTPYRVTIKWDLSESGPIIRIFLNGEVVCRQGSTEPLSPPIPAAVSTGINAFRITLGSSENNLGKAFIGPMRAASGSVSDIEQAEDPRFER